jgi:hypothetical protein
MLNLDVFLPRLLPSVNGCPEPLARQALIDSAIEFCEETGIVRVTTDPTPLQPGVATYSVDLPASQATVQIQRAWYGPRELTAAPDSQITAVKAYVTDPNAAFEQIPLYFHESAPGEVALYPTPGLGATNSLVLRVSTKPTRSATSVEDILYEDWAEAIVSGALRRVHAVPDTPFYSVNESARHGSLFQLGINRARSESIRGRVRTSVSVAPRAFR